jgi:hypothetical protein
MRSIGEAVIQGGVMTRRPEDVVFSATASGILLAVGAAALLIIYAAITAFDLAAPAVTQNLSSLSF